MPPAADRLTRAYLARVDDVNPRERSMVATINTGALDRYRTVIDPRGIDCKKYMENRVVLWMHGNDPQRGALPIGRNDWVRPITGPEGPVMRARTLFHYGSKKDPDGFCERLFECYKDGDMRAWSVNVVPHADGCSPPTRDEVKARPELVDCLMMYRSSELAEYSAVAVGGNAEALTADDGRGILQCVARGLALPADLVAAARAAVGPDPAAIAARIGRDGPQYLALSADGQEVGRYGGEAAAIAHVSATLADEARAAEAQEREQEPPAPLDEPVLPPLGGRPAGETRAELLGQVTGLLAEARANLEMHRDWWRGRV